MGKHWDHMHMRANSCEIVLAHHMLCHNSKHFFKIMVHKASSIRYIKPNRKLQISKKYSNTLATVVKMRMTCGWMAQSAFHANILGQNAVGGIFFFFFSLLLCPKYAGDSCENVTCGWHNRLLVLFFGPLYSFCYKNMLATVVKMWHAGGTISRYLWLSRPFRLSPIHHSLPPPSK